MNGKRNSAEGNLIFSGFFLGYTLKIIELLKNTGISTKKHPWLVSIDVVNGIMSCSMKDTLKLFEREISVICRFNYMSWRDSNYKFLFLLTCQKLILLIGRSSYFSKNTGWPEPPHWLDSIDLLNFDVLYSAEWTIFLKLQLLVDQILKLYSQWRISLHKTPSIFRRKCKTYV